MRFFAKSPESPAAGLKYSDKGHNAELLGLLLDEQRGFCAYTEKHVSSLDTCAVEHFDRTKKSTPEDGYLNYYATLQSANQRKRKKERSHAGAAFFSTRFFQAPLGFQARIRFVDGFYEEIDPGDDEARALIDYLGLNDHALFEERRKHVDRLRDIFSEAGWPTARQLEHLRTHREELSFPTALACELGLDIDAIL